MRGFHAGVPPSHPRVSHATRFRHSDPEAPAYPLLHAFAQRMHEHPKLAAYLASPMHKLPINNPSAGFGADADYSKLHARDSP